MRSLQRILATLLWENSPNKNPAVCIATVHAVVSPGLHNWLFVYSLFCATSALAALVTTAKHLESTRLAISDIASRFGSFTLEEVEPESVLNPFIVERLAWQRRLAEIQGLTSHEDFSEFATGVRIFLVRSFGPGIMGQLKSFASEIGHCYVFIRSRPQSVVSRFQAAHELGHLTDIAVARHDSMRVTVVMFMVGVGIALILGAGTALWVYAVLAALAIERLFWLPMEAEGDGEVIADAVALSAVNVEDAVEVRTLARVLGSMHAHLQRSRSFRQRYIARRRRSGLLRSMYTAMHLGGFLKPKVAEVSISIRFVVILSLWALVAMLTNRDYVVSLWTSAMLLGLYYVFKRFQRSMWARLMKESFWGVGLGFVHKHFVPEATSQERSQWQETFAKHILPEMRSR